MWRIAQGESGVSCAPTVIADRRGCRIARRVRDDVPRDATRRLVRRTERQGDAHARGRCLAVRRAPAHRSADLVVGRRRRYRLCGHRHDVRGGSGPLHAPAPPRTPTPDAVNWAEAGFPNAGLRPFRSFISPRLLSREREWLDAPAGQRRKLGGRRTRAGTVARRIEALRMQRHRVARRLRPPRGHRRRTVDLGRKRSRRDSGADRLLRASGGSSASTRPCLLDRSRAANAATFAPPSCACWNAHGQLTRRDIRSCKRRRGVVLTPLASGRSFGSRPAEWAMMAALLRRTGSLECARGRLWSVPPKWPGRKRRSALRRFANVSRLPADRLCRWDRVLGPASIVVEPANRWC